MSGSDDGTSTITPQLSSEDALLIAGQRCFEEFGYAGARLATIVGRVGVTTGAFYRRFASKADFFHALFVGYGDELQAALAHGETRQDQYLAWIETSRRHAGVVRASTEMLHRDASHATARQRLRGLCAGLLARNLEHALGWRDARTAALMLADILDQQVMMEAVGWIESGDANRIAAGLDDLVMNGLVAT